MGSWRLGLVVLAVLAGSACGGDAAGPTLSTGGDDGRVTADVSDPTGDVFGNRGPQWDVTDLSITRDTGGITVVLRFASTPIPLTSGDPNAMIGFVDFDTDLDSTTGATPIADEFRRDSASTGTGSDFQLDLAEIDADSTVPVFDASGVVMGRVRPIYDGLTVTTRIPHALLRDDDGYLNAAAIVGTQASPTDIIPNRGHLELRAASGAARNHAG